MGKKIKCVLFDLAGVLVEANHIKALNFMLRKMKLTKEKKEKAIQIFKEVYSEARKTNYKKIVEIFNQVFIDILKRPVNVKKFYQEYIETEVKIFPYTYMILHKLKNIRIKLGIITNTDDDLLEMILEKFDLKEIFDIIISSGSIKTYKPNEKIFRFALDKLKMKPEEVLWVTDSSRDATVAKSIGMKTILVNKNLDNDFLIKNLEMYL
jgi:putative hydrolase of the HAD superfamily